MLFPVAFLLLAPAALASPVATRDDTTILAADDVIVLGSDGTTKVMKESEYSALQKRATEVNTNVLRHAKKAARRTGVARRGCEESNEVQVLTDSTFVNWDVAMSPIVSASGGSATVSIAEGYSISDSVSISETLGSSLEDILSVSFSLSYTETWSTSTTASYTFTVPDGQYGLIVSEPSVRRLTGNYIGGCTDDPTYTAFTADSYTSQSYGGLEWPSGIIRLCNSSSYPVPYCVGTGTHS